MDEVNEFLNFASLKRHTNDEHIWCSFIVMELNILGKTPLINCIFTSMVDAIVKRLFNSHVYPMVDFWMKND